MFDFFSLVGDFFKNILYLFNTYTFNFGGVNASLLDILLAFIGLSMVISIFWKGAKG